MPEEFATLMLKGLPMPALLVDGDERIVSINEEAERLLGKAALGRLYMLPLRQPALREAIAAALSDARAARVRHVVPGPSQEQVHMVTVSPILARPIAPCFVSSKMSRDTSRLNRCAAISWPTSATNCERH
jgi:two-component system phosphate regulon sensor histidine kinase PhoR